MARGIPIDDPRFRRGSAILLAWQYGLSDGVDISTYLYRDSDGTYYVQHIRGPGPERDLLFQTSVAEAQRLYRQLVALAPWNDAFPNTHSDSDA